MRRRKTAIDPAVGSVGKGVFFAAPGRKSCVFSAPILCKIFLVLTMHARYAIISVCEKSCFPIDIQVIIDKKQKYL